VQLHWRLPNSAKIRPEICRKPNLAEFGKNGRISNLPKPKPKFGATLVYYVVPMVVTMCGPLAVSLSTLRLSIVKVVQCAVCTVTWLFDLFAVNIFTESEVDLVASFSCI